MTARTSLHGGMIAARALAEAGIDHAFCVPGESYLPLLAALGEVGIVPITCRHEGGASLAAEAMGRLKQGVPGLCLVTRSPGLMNAMAGINLAMQDATPLVVLAGQVATRQRGTQAFQEAKLTDIAAPLCKHVEEVRDRDGLAEAIAVACATACAGTPGPVMLSLPEDVLFGEAGMASGGGGCLSGADARTAGAGTDAGVAREWDVKRFLDLLEGSARPLLIAGGGPHMWTERARAMLHALGARATAITQQNLAAAFDLAAPPMPVVHVHPDVQTCGRNVHAAHVGVMTPEQFLAALPSEALHGNEERRAWMERLHKAHLDHSNVVPPVSEGVNPGEIFVWLREHLPAETIVASGAGNYALWLHRFFHHRNLHGQLAPVGGVMGYGLPAALAAKLRFPGRPVLAVAGDGCFQMSMADFATAAQHGLGVITLVLDNGQLGTIRLHQLRHFPNADCATALHNPDFAAFAEACGGLGLHVRETGEFMEAFRKAEEAAAAGRPALLHIHVSPDAIAPGLNVGDVRDS